MFVFYFVASTLIAAPLLALVAGTCKAIWLVRGRQSVRNGPWTTRLTDGSHDMTPFQRALIAVTGIWALKSSEVVYFTAFSDSDGNRLRVGKTYRIEGCDLDARWWAITVYKNFQLIPNPQKRYSFSKSNIDTTDQNNWSIVVSAEQLPGNWIPSGNKLGILAISLRLYNPRSNVHENLSDIQLPRIFCEGNAVNDL